MPFWTLWSRPAVPVAALSAMMLGGALVAVDMAAGIAEQAPTATVSATATASAAPATKTAAATPAASATKPAAAAPAAVPRDRKSATFTDPDGTRSTYHLFTSAVRGPVKGLVVYLDGDGMYGHDNPTSTWALGGSQGVVAQAAERGYATLSVRTPDSSNRTFWHQGPSNASYVEALVQAVRRELRVTTTWLVGYSGGAQLITQFLLPAHSASFTSGGALITGGGGAPATGGSFAPAAVSGFSLHWHTGALDDGRNTLDGYNALADARRGMAFYAARSFRATRSEPAGLDHNAMGTRFGATLAEQLDRASVPRVNAPVSGTVAKKAPAAKKTAGRALKKPVKKVAVKTTRKAAIKKAR